MKKIVILLIPFLLTGCVSAKYNLNIESDLSIKEEINISATKEYFNDFYMDFPLTMVKEAYNNTELMSPIKQNGYSYELKEDNVPYPSVFVSKKYETLTSYSTDTIFKGQLFQEIFVTEDNNLITLKTSDFTPYAPDDSDGDMNKFPISDCEITIKLPFIATENNADKYDAKTNTYTWVINKKTKDKEINITFDKTRIYIYNLVFYISIGILFVLIGIGIYFGLRIKNKNKYNNTI